MRKTLRNKLLKSGFIYNQNNIKLFSIPSEDWDNINDFALYWNREEEYYYFELETIYRWKDWKQEKNYLVNIKDKFKKFIFNSVNNLDMKRITSNFTLSLLLNENKYTYIEDVWLVFEFIIDSYIMKEGDKNEQKTKN